MRTCVADHTNIEVLPRLSNSFWIVSRTILADLFYAKNARRDIDQGCLAGTREGVLDAIVAWASQAACLPISVDSQDTNIAYTPGSRILWVCGLSGSGKSAIARSVASRLDALDRLGSFYAFDETLQAELNPSTLFSTIARDLADYDCLMEKRLVDIIQKNTALRNSPNVTEQFDGFIVAPSSNLAAVGDTVVIIDAFDESSTASGRRALLSILTSRASEIPDGFKFIVTSRFERDVQEALGRETRPVAIDLFLLDDVPKDSTSRDIARYVHSMLHSDRQLRRYANDLDQVAVMAQQSFQWASTACRFIREFDDGHGGSSRDRLTRVLSGEQGLDNLYSLILDRNFKMASPAILSRLNAITGLMVCVVEPLPLRALITLSLDYNEPAEDDIDDYQQMARCLGSLMSGVHELAIDVKPLHASFADYLRDENRSGKYSVDSAESRRHLARRCLEVMVCGALRFNICDFPTSFRRNQEIENLDGLVHGKISSLLSYACRHWTRHVAGLSADRSADLELLLLCLLQDHFLYWLEVMSVLKSNPYATLKRFFDEVSKLNTCSNFKGCCLSDIRNR